VDVRHARTMDGSARPQRYDRSRRGGGLRHGGVVLGSLASIRGVSLKDYLHEGHRTAATDSRVEYDLEETPGGRLVVWPAEGGLQAEFAGRWTHGDSGAG
jgi:hypothetical protein